MVHTFATASAAALIKIFVPVIYSVLSLDLALLTLAIAVFTFFLSLYGKFTEAFYPVCLLLFLTLLLVDLSHFPLVV